MFICTDADLADQIELTELHEIAEAFTAIAEMGCHPCSASSSQLVHPATMDMRTRPTRSALLWPVKASTTAATSSAATAVPCHLMAEGAVPFCRLFRA